MAKPTPKTKPLAAERRLTATQVTGFIILPLVCMLAMVVVLLLTKG